MSALLLEMCVTPKELFVLSGIPFIYINNPYIIVNHSSTQKNRIHWDHLVDIE